MHDGGTIMPITIDWRSNVSNAFLSSKGNVAAAAKLLGINRKTLFQYIKENPHNLLIVHSDGKSYDNSIPTSVYEAKIKQDHAELFRHMLGDSLSHAMGVEPEFLGNWTHNSVEETDNKVIYRKGVIKVSEGNIYMLPSSLGAKIWFYTVREGHMPPYNSMPHATGRSGPRGSTKVTEETAAELRKMVYIPEQISNSSLRTEHPSCYNGYDGIINKLREFIVPLGSSKILSYVGKV